MLSRLVSTTTLIPFFVFFFLVTGSIAAHTDGLSARRHTNLHNRLSARELTPQPHPPRAVGSNSRRQRTSCRAPKPAAQTVSNSTSIASQQSTSAISTSSTASASKTTKAASTPKANPPSGNNVSLKPADWPTATQAGAAPAATRTSAADPFLLQLSKAYNNADNDLFNQVHVGQMTFYGQGLGACGDTYDDSSFTAAVSKLMYDAWPGATAGEMNRNPICGPFVPGRKVINQAGQFVTAVPGSQFVDVGGDGLLNCDLKSQCHIPLTATVKHGDKSIQVKIVDRCEACAVGDIDLTPTAFAALADMSLGRTSVEWSFNKY